MQQPPQQPPQQPWGNRPQRPWGTRPEPPQPPPQPPWGQPPQPPQRPWGYQPPPKEPPEPGAKPPWYRHPVGMLLIGAVVVILLALIAPAFTGGDEAPQPAPTTGAATAPAPTPGPPVTATSSTLPMTPADRLGQAVQDELGGVGTVTQVTAPPGGVLTVTWEVTPAGSAGLTRNNARFGVMRIMRAVQQAGVGTDQGVRLVGRFQLPGGATPTTVLRLRFASSTVERADFDDRRYLEAFELADAAVVHPAFRG